jgi:hypothetical protein
MNEATLSGGRLSQFGKWVGCSHRNPDSISKVTLYVCLPFLTFQTLSSLLFTNFMHN